MTPEEKKEWAAKASPILKVYLNQTIGYPNCDPRLILNLLPQMWNLLVERGMIVEGMTYDSFVYHAQAQYMKGEMQTEINRILGL